jgi:hypothetical protein
MERRRRGVVGFAGIFLTNSTNPDRWWFAPLIWAGTYLAIAAFLFAYLDAL